MEFTTKHIGGSSSYPSKIIELTVNINGCSITEDITNIDSKVDEDLITSLRNLADELEEQNNQIIELKNNN